MEDVADLKQHVQSLRHHIHGNGGLGLLKRVDVAEEEINHFRGNFVEKGECQRNRVTDYTNQEKEFKVIQDALKEMKETRASDKRMNIMVIGIILSSTLSAGGFVLAFIQFLGG